MSKKVRQHFRRSDVNDKQTLRKIRKFVPPAPRGSRLPLVGSFDPPTSPHLRVPLATPTHDNDNNIPVWENTSDRLKIVFANEALDMAGKRSVSWTLNLSPSRNNEAQRDPRGFTESLKRDLDRALKRQLGYIPWYWFGVDVANKPSDRLHLQGGIAADDNEFESIRIAMLHVGGEWASARYKDRQLLLNPNRCDDGWPTYSFRRRRRVSALIKGRTFTISGPLRSEAKSLYDGCRQVMRGEEIE
jgi:hypothetical protein